MKPLIIIFLGIYLGAFSFKGDGYIITGYTTGIPDSTLVFLEDFADHIDSAYIIGNQFVFKGKTDKPHKLYLLYVYTDSGYVRHTKRTNNLRESTFFWVENNHIIFDARNVSFKEANITGSSMEMQNKEYQHTIESYKQKMDSIKVIIRKTPRSDTLAFGKLMNEMKSVRKQRKNKTIQFIKDHPSYEISAYHLSFLKNTMDKKETMALYQGLDEVVKNTAWGKSVKTYLEKSVKLKEGDQAVEFSLPDLNGNEVSLSSFRGKYVLLEFWATGCGPCRWENPNLLKAYRKYRDKGFEILGVSLDESRKAWASTVEKDTVIWTTVCDLKGISGDVPLTYSVYYIPNNYLIDPGGTVIAKDLRGEKLQEKLKELFDKTR